MPVKLGRYPNEVTATVGELIAKLQQFDADLPVAYGWEGQITPVELDEFEVLETSKHVIVPILLMNAET
jgi:hypothetical protein